MLQQHCSSRLALDTSNLSSRVVSRRDEPSGIWVVASVDVFCRSLLCCRMCYSSTSFYSRLTSASSADSLKQVLIRVMYTHMFCVYSAICYCWPLRSLYETSFVCRSRHNLTSMAVNLFCIVSIWSSATMTVKYPLPHIAEIEKKWKNCPLSPPQNFCQLLFLFSVKRTQSAQSICSDSSNNFPSKVDVENEVISAVCVLYDFVDVKSFLF